jgi:energy-coupling factor transporter ATP-binding protein EcfA2
MSSQERPPDTVLAPISAIEVDGLHAARPYRLNLIEADSGSSSMPFFTASEGRLSLLYGKNGTGKTTLLRMLFDGLSSAPDRGHRNALGRIRFRSFSVAFANGDRVEYVRPDATNGGFTASVTIAGETSSWQFIPNSRRRATLEQDPRTGVVREVVLSDSDAQDREDFHRALGSLALNPVFLRDTRVLTSDLVDPGDPDRSMYVGGGRYSNAQLIDQMVQTERDADLTDALLRVREYLRRVVFAGAQRGAERADTVYARVTEAIVGAPAKRGRPLVKTIPNLIERVRKIDARASPFVSYGLLSAVPAKRFVAALSVAEPPHGWVLEQVLTPYLDGLEERMDELESGRRAIAGYVDTINSFFEGKTLDFLPATGVAITAKGTHDQLEPSELSSGEKQILVLFSDVVALREETRLFLIDEPELSLNPQWQRSLMPAFLAVTEGTAMQLLAATHSIEIMARYRDRLVQLAP